MHKDDLYELWFLYFAALQHRFIPYLNLVEPKVLSDIVINEVLPILSSQPQGVSVNYICRHLGGLIHARYAMRCKIEGGVIEKVSVFLCRLDFSLIVADSWGAKGAVAPKYF